MNPRVLKGEGLRACLLGIPLVSRKCTFFEGQEFFSDYDVHITAGSFVIRLYKVSGTMDPDTHFLHKVLSDEKGQAHFLIQESGLYQLVFEGSVLGNSAPGSGYHLNYAATWGMR